MSETANFNMKLPKSMKEEAQATFKSMGMDMPTATRLSYTAVHRSSATSACAPTPIPSAASRTRRILSESAACCTKWAMR